MDEACRAGGQNQGLIFGRRRACRGQPLRLRRLEGAATAVAPERAKRGAARRDGAGLCSAPGARMMAPAAAL